MTAGESRVPEYLRHMRQAVQRILRYMQGMTEAAFQVDERTQDAVVRNIEILGEAARNVRRADPAFVAAHPEISWDAIYGMRNRLVHAYFAVDLGVLWQTAHADIPALEQQLRALPGE